MRLERLGGRVSAFCSPDSENWFIFGRPTSHAEDPVQVDLHRIGHIDRKVYHGAYPEGTAIRFESFQLGACGVGGIGHCR